jgi:aminoglycoside 6'-N-acetyltransferase I
MQIRSAVPGDASAWLKMRNDLWPDHEGKWHALEIARYFNGELRMPLEVLVAADGDGSIVGFAELSIRPYVDDCETENVAYLEGWYVIPSARKKGVGRALVAEAEAWARRKGCTEFGSDALLDNETSAIAHRALGFTETAQVRLFKKNLT